MTRIKNWTLGKYVAVRHIGIEDAMHREEGQGLAEYGLILALVAVACVAALGLLATGLKGILGSVAGHL